MDALGASLDVPGASLAILGASFGYTRRLVGETGRICDDARRFVGDARRALLIGLGELSWVIGELIGGIRCASQRESARVIPLVPKL